MNKDQKLLEEAYQSICESTEEPLYFGPEEDKKTWMEWLNRWLKYEVIGDGSINVLKGDVVIANTYLKRLPFNFNKVSGIFDCHGNELTSLQGAPKIIGGSFACDNNRLTSLEGSPKKIKGNFFCSFNKLTTLKGSPQTVNGDFFCHKNKLTSLEGAPDVIKERFVHDKFTDEDYRLFVKKREISRRVAKELSPDLNIDLEDFS
jgi:hypothetical protein